MAGRPLKWGEKADKTSIRLTPTAKEKWMKIASFLNCSRDEAMEAIARGNISAEDWMKLYIEVLTE